ncbi:hypothetical protein HanIR_Chr06g0292021 [Helianthus annuus]|nr:hypothetical protein HanIR_Chr06g0292021 [Helianthus annuus]
MSKSKCSHKEKTRGKNLNCRKFQLLLLAFAILLGSNEVTDDLHCQLMSILILNLCKCFYSFICFLVRKNPQVVSG